MASNFFFISLDELSQTESQYSSNGRIKESYIRSREFLLTLNLRARIRLSLIHAFSQMVPIWSGQRQELEKVIPKCLCVWVSLICVLFINSGGWIGLLTFLDMTIDKVFAALKFTSQKSAQSLMLCKSPLSIIAAVLAFRRQCTNLYRQQRDGLMHQYF